MQASVTNNVGQVPNWRQQRIFNIRFEQFVNKEDAYSEDTREVVMLLDGDKNARNPRHRQLIPRTVVNECIMNRLKGLTRVQLVETLKSWHKRYPFEMPFPVGDEETWQTQEAYDWAMSTYVYAICNWPQMMYYGDGIGHGPEGKDMDLPNAQDARLRQTHAERTGGAAMMLDEMLGEESGFPQYLREQLAQEESRREHCSR